MNPWAIAAAVWLPVSVIAGLAIGRWMRGPKTPAPGPSAHPPSARQQETQPLPPAPAITGPHDVAFTITTRRCGWMRAWDGHGTLIARRDCHCAANWHQWEEELARD